MASDNSCLFTAFGGALLHKVRPRRLREQIAEHIMANPTTYTEAILAMPPEEYCSTLRLKDRWGGAIELSILSELYGIEICAFDVEVRPQIHTSLARASNLANPRTGAESNSLR